MTEGDDSDDDDSNDDDNDHDDSDDDGKWAEESEIQRKVRHTWTDESEVGLKVRRTSLKGKGRSKGHGGGGGGGRGSGRVVGRKKTSRGSSGRVVGRSRKRSPPSPPSSSGSSTWASNMQDKGEEAITRKKTWKKTWKRTTCSPPQLSCCPLHVDSTRFGAVVFKFVAYVAALAFHLFQNIRPTSAPALLSTNSTRTGRSAERRGLGVWIFPPPALARSRRGFIWNGPFG